MVEIISLVCFLPNCAEKALQRIMMNGYGSHSVLTLDLHDYLSTLVYMKDEQYFNEEQLTRLSDRLEKPQVMGIHDKEFILP
ncbi:MAG: hypothetical protein MK193_07825, partial [Lentisphaeria bacterium]|nr:hypothetical protein [Lentisphaeria bacterium]